MCMLVFICLCNNFIHLRCLGFYPSHNVINKSARCKLSLNLHLDGGEQSKMSLDKVLTMLSVLRLKSDNILSLFLFFAWSVVC